MSKDTLSRTFAAVADPTRRAILARLEAGPSTVGELSEPFALSPPAISKHLKVLERAGLVERRKQAQWRHCSLKAEPLREAADWIERYRALWERNFEALDRLLEELATDDAQDHSTKDES